MAFDINQYIDIIAGVGTILFILFYIYLSLALMIIAKKTNTSHAWFAWIPFLNLYLMMKIADARLWTFIVFLLGIFIPVIGSLLTLGITILWWWGIAEARNKSGFLGILMIIPLVNLVILGYLAWSE